MTGSEPTGAQNLDLHLTLLFGWLVRTLGDALLKSLLIPSAIGLVAAILQEPDLLWLGVAVGPVVFAWALSRVEAPMPSDVAD